MFSKEEFKKMLKNREWSAIACFIVEALVIWGIAIARPVGHFTKEMLMFNANGAVTSKQYLHLIMMGRIGSFAILFLVELIVALYAAKHYSDTERDNIFEEVNRRAWITSIYNAILFTMLFVELIFDIEAYRSVTYIICAVGAVVLIIGTFFIFKKDNKDNKVGVFVFVDSILTAVFFAFIFAPIIGVAMMSKF